MTLLYADDPGAANYLAPIARALGGENDQRLVVDPQLRTYVADRRIECAIRGDASPGHLLGGADLLVVGTSENPDCFGHQLTIEARRSGRPSVGVVDMRANADRRFKGRSDSPLQFAPDYLVVPDSPTRDAFTSLGFSAAGVFVCGHPHYDEVRERRRQFEAGQPSRVSAFCGAPPERPIWLFIAEGVDQLNAPASFRSNGYTLAGRGDTEFRSAIVLEEILDAAAMQTPRPWVVLRLHPKSRVEEFAPCLDDVDAVSSGGDPLPLLWAADLVLGMTSMLLLEAALLGKPHLSVLPRAEERAWLTPLSSGLTPVAGTRAQLAEQLAAGVPPPNPERLADILPERCTERAVAVIRALGPGGVK